MGMSTICKINGPSLMSVELAQRDLSSRKVKVGHFLRLPTMSLDRGTRIRAFSPSWSTDSWKSKKGHGFKESKQLDAAVKLFESVVTVAVPPQIRTLEKGLGQAAMGKAFVILDGDFDDLNPVDSIQHLISLTSNILSPRHLPYIKIGSVHELGKPAPYEPDLEYSLTRKLRLLCDGDSDLPVKMSLAYLQTIETWNHANNVAYLDDRKIVWTSHECSSMLPYEQALTKKDPTTGLYYSCSAHMLWIGEDFADAHVEFLRGISNPIGIKITAASKLSADNLIKLITLLNPDKRPGRITVLTDFPSHLIAAKLPSFIQAVNRAHQIVTWLIHPAADRAMDDIQAFIKVLGREESYLGGLELSTRDGTENVGRYGDNGIDMAGALTFAINSTSYLFGPPALPMQ